MSIVGKRQVRLKHLLCCLSLSALSALSGTVGGPGAPLRIYTSFQQQPSPELRQTLERELSSLLAPIGLDVEWRALDSPTYGESSRALVVTSFNGSCDVNHLPLHYNSTGPLAWTHITDGVILPFVDVDCERLRALLAGKLQAADSKERGVLFGRALARVIGHELYHVFVETRRHDKEGIAQPAVSASELLSDDFDFGEKELRTLRTSKLKSLLRIVRPPSQSVRTEYDREGCGACHGSSGEGTRIAPSLRMAKTLDPKVLTHLFEKRREDMYRRARSLNLYWEFPTDEEVAQLVAALENGLQ